MTDDTDYSNHPLTISEIKSNRSGNAVDWTPRDILIRALRRIDNGEWKPDALVIVGREMKGPGETSTTWFSAGPDVHTTLGLLQHAIIRQLTDENGY